MNSFELERILSLIEVNVQTNQPLLRGEVLRYIEGHEDEVLEELRRNGEAMIQTSVGKVPLRLAELQAAVA